MRVSAHFCWNSSGGATEELAAALQYWVQSSHVEDAGIGDMRRHIAMEEFRRFELAG
jgi:Mn-containing catalase